MTSPALLAILANARAGAVDRAWRMFTAAGLDRDSHDPEVACIHGRLLKDRAAGQAPGKHAALYRDAAAAYERAARLRPATYPLINAATLSLLAGEEAEAAILAAQVLDRIAAEPDEPETPYWRAATRAEALLLLGREADAREALAEAVALAPRAWEDHASTLRQFALILAAQGRDSAWLGAHRPPSSLHFGGHMSFDARVGRRSHVDDRIRAVLDEEKVGFGYGALAAGADILIAEALVERGAELHAVLPGGAEAFAAVSVDPFGRGWRRRFDRLLAAAATVRAVRPLATRPDRRMIALGDEIAMGAAAMNARRLQSVALQLLVLAEAPADPAAGAVRRRVVTAPREALPPGDPPALPLAPHRRLALLAVAASDPARLASLAARLGGSPAAAVPPYFTGREVVLAYAEPVAAAEAAAALAAAPAGGEGFGVGGHYGMVDLADDPFSGEARLTGDAAALAAAAAASAPPGTACVTADFAAALAAAGAAPFQAELIGELAAGDGGAAVDLYAVKPRL
ncbi:MAG: DUF4071 domain-containing protein [Alphaproteobacteria bacterium]|nr:DUF4071 domain-containing protein [Alphaproteobacteria bacterium]MBV9372036.1 DUF4071 domain-containing protein [Alphaproteobacteria bacterium]MBV9902654.1 DUF4071 domain-containing protein [Alphaproteobacteria bacterium]